jgi:DNA-binding response OmpR family regulator
MRGSALVVLDDERLALTTVLVLQEMCLDVYVASDRDIALQAAAKAGYAVVVCGGQEQPQISEFAIRLRYSAPQTRVILLAGPELSHDELNAIDVEVLPAPVDVNMLVERLWPAEAK